MSSSVLLAISPIKRNSAADQVAKKILDLVRAGDLEPRDQLPPEGDLAQMFQISRPTLREATPGLQILGVVKSRPGRACISSVDAADLFRPQQFLITLKGQNVHALCESRALIDGGIARVTPERLSATDLSGLEAIVGVKHWLLADPAGFRVLNLEFYLTIMQWTSNPFLVRVSHSLCALGMHYRRLASETPGALSRSLAYHERIVEAHASRDPEAAERMMVAHIESGRRSILAAMAELRGDGA